MAMYKLTVAIPTYNRAEPLAHTLSVVLPQVLAHEGVQLVILDNASEVPARQVLDRVAGGGTLPERVRVIRHAFNIGGNANILRCFEVAEGEWLWCLGDDDEPDANAIATILRDIAEPDLIYAFYGCRERIVSRDVQDWIEQVPSYGKRLFISQGLYKLDVVRRYTMQSYVVAASGAAHMATAFSAITDGLGSYLLSPDTIAVYQHPSAGGGYNSVPLAYGSATLLTLITDDAKRALWEKFFKHTMWRWTTPYLLLYQLMLLHKTRDSKMVVRGFGLIADLLEPSFLENVRMWLRWKICRVFSHFPRLYYWIVKRREAISGWHYESGTNERWG